MSSQLYLARAPPALLLLSYAVAYKLLPTDQYDPNYVEDKSKKSWRGGKETENETSRPLDL